MPFELGIDFGCREFEGAACADKRFLILEEKRYRYQAAISDIAGCDIETHSGDPKIAIGKVRNWLVNEAGAENVGTSKLEGKRIAFQQWYWEMQSAAGASEADIKGYPTKEVLAKMREWLALGEPV